MLASDSSRVRWATPLTSASISMVAQRDRIRAPELASDAAELPKSLALAEAANFPRLGSESGTPGVRYKGDWDSRPHPARVVRVDRETLDCVAAPHAEMMMFRSSQARLLSPVSTEEQDAIRALADYPMRLGDFDPQISSGFHESGAKKEGLIKYDLSHPGDWSEVILKGIQIGVGESDVQIAGRQQ